MATMNYGQPVVRPAARPVRPLSVRDVADEREGPVTLGRRPAGTLARVWTSVRYGALASVRHGFEVIRAGRTTNVLSILPCSGVILFTLAAWDLARPLGLLVAGVSCFFIEWRYDSSRE